jgi:hypothetical protein
VRYSRELAEGSLNKAVSTMKCVWTIAITLLLGSCSFAAPKPSELIGAWKATELSRGDFHAPLGRPYKLVFKAADRDNLFDVMLFGCNAENFVYSIDGLRVINSCGTEGTICTTTLISCFMSRVNLDGSISPDEGSCTDKFTYCRRRLMYDDDLLIKALRTPSTLHFSGGNLVVSSEMANAQVTFQRDDR